MSTEPDESTKEVLSIHSMSQLVVLFTVDCEHTLDYVVIHKRVPHARFDGWADQIRKSGLSQVKLALV